jgi:hypothetical protein
LKVKKKKQNKPYSNIWVERSMHDHPTRGVAEIYVDGGRLSYVKKTCVGRIFQKHLDRNTITRLINTIERALIDAIEGVKVERKPSSDLPSDGKE